MAPPMRRIYIGARWEPLIYIAWGILIGMVAVVLGVGLAVWWRG